MGVSPSADYVWVKRPDQLISAVTLHLHRRAKMLFRDSRQRLGRRELMKKLREKGCQVRRCKVRRVMKALDLIVTLQLAYNVTTKRKHFDKIAPNLPNLPNQNVNSVGKDKVWAGNVTYLRTTEDWIYLAIATDLTSRRKKGGISIRMTTDLISKAQMKTYNLRQPPKGLGFHNDRGSQYTSKRFGGLLKTYGLRASIGGVGACYLG
jgi:putative transposase